MIRGRRRLAMCCAAAAGLVGCGGGSGPPMLDTIVLRGSQVGPGYVLQQRPDGHGVAGYVTLDLCGSAFPSEALRTDRLQVNYVHAAPGAPVARVSNEVVSYYPGGAQQALREVADAAAHCPRGPVDGPVAGEIGVTYRVGNLTDAGLAPGYVALKVHIAAKGQSITAVVVYQARGNVLSGVYVTAASDLAAARALALHAAEEAAHNLG